MSPLPNAAYPRVFYHRNSIQCSGGDGMRSREQIENKNKTKTKQPNENKKKTRRTSSTAAMLLRFQVECPPQFFSLSPLPPSFTCGLKLKEVGHQFQGLGDQVQTTSVPPSSSVAKRLFVCKQSLDYIAL
ncbi:hypothetical protein CEXT_183861 [Caerostris extrusa]|uniref:Uncharacterized protein n=1 Tax=Caerostris extrusa TaxID=172846 RepID=A0AAV4NTW6_CAEEX|nr:hypothetical protein CEXT_183861 [Caerostris extrusa]